VHGWPFFFHLLLSISRESLSQKSPIANFDLNWSSRVVCKIKNVCKNEMAHWTLCWKNRGRPHFRTFVFRPSKVNNFGASNFTWIMRKIWDFFCYQNLNFDEKMGGGVKLLIGSPTFNYIRLCQDNTHKHVYVLQHYSKPYPILPFLVFRNIRPRNNRPRNINLKKPFCQEH